MTAPTGPEPLPGEMTTNEIKDWLRRQPLFQDLPGTLLADLASFCQVRTFFPGDYIYQKNTTASQFYLVVSGGILISDQAGGTSANLDELEAMARFIPGDIFGHQEFFLGDYPRSNWAVAESETRLIIFPRAGISREELQVRQAGLLANLYPRLIAMNAGRMRAIHALISEKTGWVEDIRRKMYIDPLTGALNRAYLEEELSGQTERLGETFGVLVVKPDSFKTINDTFGHEAGDQALQVIARKLLQFSGPEDEVIRYRGNEFIIIKPGKEARGSLAFARYCHTILNELDIGRQMGRESLRQNFSIGLAVYPTDNESLLTLVEMAFSRVFKQREKGGNGVEFEQSESVDLIQFLQTVKIFSQLRISELDQLARYLNPLEFAAGDVICRQDEPGEELFLIRDGETSVRIATKEGDAREIARLAGGEFFGEMAIFENAPRSATIIALEDSRAYALSKENFLNMIQFYPITATNIMRAILRETDNRLRESGNFVSQMLEWGEEASLRAITDPLTGLFNRRHLESQLTREFNRSYQTEQPLSLLMADMDHFREVNDRFGHEAGDRYIQAVGEVFRKVFRDKDVVARFGGDEFTILLPETPVEQARVLADAARLAVAATRLFEEENPADGPAPTLSLSLGLASFPEHCETRQELTRRADEALYQAKNNGRNQVVGWGDLSRDETSKQ